MPVAAPALADLVWIAVLLFAFAFAWTARKLIAALFGSLIALLESIPAIGNYLSSPFHATEQAVANALGAAEGAIDTAIGASWHFLARLTGELWHELEAHATLLLEISTGIYPIVLAIRAVKALAHESAQVLHGIEHGVKSLVKEWHGIERRVKTLEHEIAAGIGNDVRVGLKATEKELGLVTSDVIPAIQAAEAQSEAAISNLYEWAKGKASLLGIGTFSVAVAAALTALGLGGLMCRNFGNLLSKWGCGLGAVLDGLLGLVVSGLILTNICDMLGLLEVAYGDVAGPLISFLTEVPLGGCEVPPASWSQLNVAAGPLPPRQTLGALPV